MRHLLFLVLIAGVVLVCSVKQSVQAAPNQEELGEELQTFFVHYVSNYNAYLKDGDDLHIERAVKYYSDPTMALGWPPLAMPSSEVKTNITRALRSFKNKGVSLMKWTQIDVCPLSHNTAVASNVISRFTQDGTVQSELGATFMLAKGPDGWKIAAISLYKADHGRSLITCAHIDSY